MIKYLPVAVLFTGGAVLAAVLGPSVMGTDTPAPTPKARTVYIQPATGAGYDLSASSGLFGQSQPAQAPALSTAASLPDMELTGVLAAETPEASFAMIRTEDGIGVYRLGDTVTAPFALTQIAQATVTVSDGTRDHVLQFTDITSTPRLPTRQQADAGPYRTAAHRAISAPLKKPETTTEYIEYWRERVRRNPGEVMTEIGLAPEPRGYRISKEQDIGVRLAGFRSGDLITAVNGIPVGNADEDRKHIDAIVADGFAQVSFERNGEARVLTFPLR